jgi:hypothetical protein
MADRANSTRRDFLRALPATALALSAVALPAQAGEDAASKVDRLTQELSETLSDYCQGMFRAIVDPSNAPNSQVFLQNMRVSPGRGAAARSVDQPGKAMMMFGERTVIFDTSDLPRNYTVQHEDEGAGAWAETVCVPEPDAEYVVLTWEGEIVVTRLVDGYGDKYGNPRRRGYVAAGPRVKHVVQVLGKVV